MPKKTFDHPPKRVALFVTCMVDMMYPNVGIATAELLEREGIQVYFPEEQTCCGQPAFNAGYRDEARQLARRFIDIFEPLIHNGTVDAVVAPSGSCVAMTSHFYQTLFHANPNDPYGDPYVKRAERLAAATFELTEFLVDVVGVSDVGARLSNSTGAVPTLTYHACCHLLRELRVDVQPRALLSSVQGATVVEMEESDACCGFGGLFSIKNAGISAAIGDRKVKNLNQSGADVVAMCDVSCMTHINGLLEKQGQPARAVHIAEVLNQQVGIGDGGMVDGGIVDGGIVDGGIVDGKKKETQDVKGRQGSSLERAASKPKRSEPILPKPVEPRKAKPKAEPAPSRPRRWQDY